MLLEMKIFDAEFLSKCLTTLTTKEEAIDNDLLTLRFLLYVLVL